MARWWPWLSAVLATVAAFAIVALIVRTQGPGSRPNAGSAIAAYHDGTAFTRDYWVEDRIGATERPVRRKGIGNREVSSVLMRDGIHDGAGYDASSGGLFKEFLPQLHRRFTSALKGCHEASPSWKARATGLSRASATQRLVDAASEHLRTPRCRGPLRLRSPQRLPRSSRHSAPGQGRRSRPGPVSLRSRGLPRTRPRRLRPGSCTPCNSPGNRCTPRTSPLPPLLPARHRGTAHLASRSRIHPSRPGQARLLHVRPPVAGPTATWSETLSFSWPPTAQKLSNGRGRGARRRR